MTSHRGLAGLSRYRRTPSSTVSTPRSLAPLARRTRSPRLFLSCRAVANGPLKRGFALRRLIDLESSGSPRNLHSGQRLFSDGNHTKTPPCKRTRDEVLVESMRRLGNPPTLSRVKNLVLTCFPCLRRNPASPLPAGESLRFLSCSFLVGFLLPSLLSLYRRGAGVTRVPIDL